MHCFEGANIFSIWSFRIRDTLEISTEIWSSLQNCLLFTDFRLIACKRAVSTSSPYAISPKQEGQTNCMHAEPSLHVCCREGSSYVLNGHKWWASGAPDPRCKICIFMGKTDPSAAVHKQQSMILVPMNARGLTVVRPLPVFGYDDAPHGHAEVTFQARLAICLPHSDALHRFNTCN